MAPNAAADAASFRRFHRWLVAACVFTFGVMVLGSATRATASGLACPDWPLCYGQLVPTFDMHVFFEWFHRLVAGLLGVALLVATAMVVRRPVLRRVFGPQLALAAALMALQIALGALTVTRLLDPRTVAGHLTNATLFLTLLVWMARKAGTLARGDVAAAGYALAPARRALVLFAAVAVFAQIFAGGLVSSHYAGVACADFPTCRDGYFLPPHADPLTLIHVAHRVVAAIVLLAAASLRLGVFSAPVPSRLARVAQVLPTLVLLQIGLGAYNVLASLPHWASVSHLANAELIYVLLVFAAYDVVTYGRAAKPLPRAAPPAGAFPSEAVLG